MQNNIFLVSDASYSFETKVAGLGVVNLSNGLRYSTSTINIPSSNDAEFRALLYSIHIALRNNLDNVVFVYDNLSLNLSSIKQYLTDKISTFQFLWLKRDFVHEADRVAFKARALRETLLVSSSSNVKLSVLEGDLKDVDLLVAFKEKPLYVLFRTSSIITDEKNKEIIYHYLNRTCPKRLHPEQSLDYRFLNFIYLLLSSEKRIGYFNYLEKNVVKDINKQKLKLLQKNSFYIVMIKNILGEIKIMKNHSVKESLCLRELVPQ
jgi:hypothetical protein